MSLTTALDFTCGAGLVAAFAATPFFFVNWIRYLLALKRARFLLPREQVPFPTKTVLFFVMPILVAVAAPNVAIVSSQRKVVEFLRQPGAAQFTVLVSGGRAANSSAIVLA